jgi:hypothetical protein
MRSEDVFRWARKLPTTLPGFRLERRQVEVSVVQQLKQRRRTRSLSLVAASSVCTIWKGAALVAGAGAAKPFLEGSMFGGGVGPVL